MGIMENINKLPKAEREKAHQEYLEVKNRLKEMQKPKQTKKIRKKSERKNGKVITYQIRKGDE